MSCCIHATLKRAVDSFQDAINDASGIYLWSFDSRNLFRSVRNSWDDKFFINSTIKIIKIWLEYYLFIIWFQEIVNSKKPSIRWLYIVNYFVRGIASIYSYKGILLTQASDRT